MLLRHWQHRRCVRTRAVATSPHPSCLQHSKSHVSLSVNSPLFVSGAQQYTIHAGIFSVWSQALTVPVFTMRHAFDSSITDISWSSDGRHLLLASKDGTVLMYVRSTMILSFNGAAARTQWLAGWLSSSYLVSSNVVVTPLLVRADAMNLWRSCRV